MDPTFHRKPFVRALIEVVSLGITHKRIEDAETVLVAVRQLRPHLTELDTFEAWIAISRGHWHDAIRTLNNLDANTRNWSLGRALMAFCQFAVGDPAWSVSAHEVIEGDSTQEARSLVRLLLGKDVNVGEPEPDASAATSFADYDPRSLPHAPLLRA
jgi:type III secretion protein HrpB1